MQCKEVVWIEFLGFKLITPIGNILGPSPSVIFGNKIQKIFLLWRFWWRHTSNIWNLVIISQNSKGYSTYTRNILSTWRHHRQKFALDFVSENDARWKTQFLDFVSEICQYGLTYYVSNLWITFPVSNNCFVTTLFVSSPISRLQCKTFVTKQTLSIFPVEIVSNLCFQITFFYSWYW